MGAFIVLGDGRAWAAANWAYDTAIRCIADELPESSEGRELKAWLLLQTCEYRGPGLASVDVRELAADDRALFEEAALRAIVTSKEKGPAGWRDPNVFPRWQQRFEELAKLIASIRAGEPPEHFNPHMRGVIVGTGERVGPGWQRFNRLSGRDGQ